MYCGGKRWFCHPEKKVSIQRSSSWQSCSVALCFGPCTVWEKNVQCHCSTHAASSLVMLGRIFVEAVSLEKKTSLWGIPAMLVPCAQLYPNSFQQYHGRVLGWINLVDLRKQGRRNEIKSRTIYPAMGCMPGMGQSPLRGRDRVSKGKQRRTILPWPYGGSLGAITATTYKFPLRHLRSVKQNTRSELDCERTGWNIRYWNLLFLQHSSLLCRESRTPAGAKQSQTNTAVT